MLNLRCWIVLAGSLGIVLSPFQSDFVLTAFAQEQVVSIAVSGLTNPRGFVWDADGTLIIAEAGAGGSTEASGEVDVPPPTGPYTGGPSARVMTSSNGCLITLAEGLPSAQSASGEVIGVADVAYLGETLFALVSGGGAAHGNPDNPNGIYTIGANGEFELLVDLGQWVRDNPVENPPANDFDPEGSFFSMAAAADGSTLWVVESNSEQILAVTPEGDVTRMADLSASNQAPTAIAPAPDGGFYVGEHSSAPFPEGAARVLKIDQDGNVTTAWSGLTTIAGLAVDADGVLYATQLSTTRPRPPFLQPGTGSIVRQSGKSSLELVATGLNFPTALEFGPDDGLYVASPAIGASDGAGSILRLMPGDAPIAVDIATLSQPVCSDGTGADDANGNSTGGVGTSGDGTGSTGQDVDVTPPTASEVIVRIFDFGFDHATLTIPAGTTVTWANTGAVQHTVLALANGERYVDSGIMEPGTTFSFAFSEAGAWDYVCGLHPAMTGKIIVE